MPAGSFVVPAGAECMDSRVVNKLIRSEVWPLLRSQGFSKFDSRNAWRYREPLIDVVNFRSFNSYVAGCLGCTTYSFGVNLGIYIVGGPNEEWVKKDAVGRLVPPESHCSLRTGLKDSIFYIDPEGHSLGPVFTEVRNLLQNQAPQWYSALGNLDAVIAWMNGSALPPGLPEERGRGVTAAAPGSLVWNDCSQSCDSCGSPQRSATLSA